MIKVVFVGDEPSKLNISENIPFVGAKCFKTLVEWIKFILPDYYVCLNSKHPLFFQDIQDLANSGFKIIALGINASKVLKSYNLGHHKMDHPSGLNRKLNDKHYTAEMLIKAFRYVRR